MSERGRRWSLAALLIYAFLFALLLPSVLTSSVLLPIPVLLTVIAWRHDRPSWMRAAATTVSVAVVAVGLLLLAYHLIWGDLSGSY